MARTIINTSENKDKNFIAEIHCDKKQGVKITNGDTKVEFIPKEGDFSNITRKVDYILYENVFENIDYKYTSLKNSIKEDIIIKMPSNIKIFEYYLKVVNGEINYENNEIIISEPENNEIVFKITAPIMMDAENNESDKIELALSKENGVYIVTVKPDEEWLDHTQRIYPVTIDPIFEKIMDKDGEMCTVEQNADPTIPIWGNNYFYVGFDDGVKTGTGQEQPGGLWITRIYSKINIDGIPLDAKINSAYFKIYQRYNYSNGTNQIGLFRTLEDWDYKTLTYPMQEQMEHEMVAGPITTNTGNAFLTFDITELVNNWVQGLYPNYGIVLKSLDERNMQCELMGTPNWANGDINTAPQWIVDWEIPDPVDENIPLDDLTLNLRPITEKNFMGKMIFDGVFVDGVTKPGSMVECTLNPYVDGMTSINRGAYSYKYPDSAIFNILFPDGTKYKSKDSNWQTSNIFINPEFDTLYKFYGNASKDGATGITKESDTFIVYEVKQKDTFPFIANYYGVSLETILVDNRVQDQLLMENNTIFIRNPQKNTDKPYNPGPLTEEQKRSIDAQNIGRGFKCEFGYEPINLNTGNFYMELVDAKVKDLGGDFTITRSYSSKAIASSSMFGRKWSFNHCGMLTQIEDGTIIYYKEDGGGIYFTPDGNGGYTCPEGTYYTLRAVDYSETERDYIAWEVEDSSKNITSFDRYGLEREKTDLKGHTTKMNYDENYNLAEIISPSGKTFKLTLDDDGRIVKIVLPNNAELQYSYDENGNLVSFTDAIGKVTTYQYNDSYLMTSWTDQNGNKNVENVYDEKERVILQKDAIGNQVRLEYTDGMTKVTDAEGYIIKYYYDDSYRTTKIEHPDGSVEQKTYDLNGNLKTYKDGMGYVTEYKYDTEGNVIEEKRYDGYKKTSIYNSFNQPTKITNFDGAIILMEYDNKGNLTKIINPDRSEIQYEYDEFSRMVKSIDPKGNESIYTYDGANMITSTDPKGNIYTFSYNDMNEVIEACDPEGNSKKVLYNERGDKLKEEDKDGGCTSYTYDDTGYVTQIKDPLGLITSFVHNAAGDIVETTDPKGNKTKYSYNRNRLETKREDARGSGVISLYDGMGRVIRDIDKYGVVRNYTYDKQGNLTSKKEPLNSNTSIAWNYIYKAPVRITNPDGGITRFTYDRMGRTKTMTQPNGAVINYDYDILGRVIKTTEPSGLITEMKYDLNGNVVEIKDNGARVFKYEYDENNNLIKTINPEGGVQEYFYDSLNRQIKAKNEESQETLFLYDPKNRLKEVKDALGYMSKIKHDLNGNITETMDKRGYHTKYSYKTMNLLDEIEDARGNKTSYIYDESENLIETKDPLNGILKHDYSIKNLLTKVTDQIGNIYEMQYDVAGNNTLVKYPNEDEVKMEYDNMRRLIYSEDAKGLKKYYEYDTMGNISKEWDNAGNSFIYGYDLSNRLVKKTDVLGREETYTYDILGRVIREKLIDENENKYTYDLLGRVKTFTDGEDKTTYYEYDKLGNIISKTEPGDAVYRYLYDSLNRLIKTIDPLGGVTEIEYDENGNIIKTIDPEGHRETYKYDPLNTLIETTDKNTNTTIFNYDSLSRLTCLREPEGGVKKYKYDLVGNLIETIDQRGAVTNHFYDSMGNRIKTTLPGGGDILYSYDPHGVLKEMINPRGARTVYETDLNDMVTKMINPNCGVYEYKYDVMSRLTEIKNPIGLVTSFMYDAKNNMVQQRDNLTRVTNFCYDKMHRMKAAIDGKGNRTSYSYDIRGNLNSVINQKGAEERYTFDVMDRMTSSIDPLGKITKYKYDLLGRLEEEIKPGNRISSFNYDGNGNVIKATDPMENSAYFRYNRNNLVTEQRDPLGNITSLGYDLAGNVISNKNPNGEVTKFDYTLRGHLYKKTEYINSRELATLYGYDLQGNLNRVQDPLGRTSYYSYDLEDNLISQKDAKGNVTEYTYDLMNNMTSIKNPMGQIKEIRYDIAGRLRSIIYPSGKRINYNYDILNQLILKSCNDENEKRASYFYNSLGERISLDDATGVSNYKYDPLGRLIETTQDDGKKVKYEYNEQDQLEAITYPDGRVVKYEYDKNNRLVKLIDGNKFVDYKYDAVGRVIFAKHSNGVWTKYRYDKKGQVIELKNTKKKEVCCELISSFEYTYDELGNIVQEIAMEGKTKILRTFEYDDLNQIISFTEAQASQWIISRADTTHINYKYCYDKAGNRIKIIKNGTGIDETITYEYNENNELIREISSKDGNTEYRYDKDGNLIHKTNFNKYEDIRYSYTIENRLKVVRNGGRLMMAATYNADGDRMFSASRKNNRNQMSQDRDYKSGKKEELFDDVEKVFLTYANAMMLKKDGSVLAGGSDIYGNLGIGITNSYTLVTPQPINTLNIEGNVVKVALGYRYSMLLDDEGKIYTTGYNYYGQLGHGNTTNYGIFTKVLLPEGIKIKDISVSYRSSYALDEEGNLWGWGYNGNGELGNGTKQNLKSPEKIQTDVKLVYGSNQGYSTYIVKNDGKLYACGANGYGQLGLDEDTPYYYEFTHVPFFDDKEIVDIKANQYDVKILTKDGNVYVAGRNSYGQLGLGNITDVKKFGPKMILPMGRKVTRIFDLYNSSIVELDDGQIWGCGENSSGALGFRSNYNVGGVAGYDKYFLTNPVTLEMVQADRSTITIPPVSESSKTSAEIYEGGNGRIIDLQTGYKVTIMIDASGKVRATGTSGKSYTSTLYENNGGSYSFNRLVQKVDVKLEDPVIPEELEENLDTNYDLVHYVNNINLPNTEVLTEYRNRDKTETNYTYGLERVWGIQRVSSISLKEEYYIYDGRGSVSALANQVGNVVTQYRYDPFGVMTKNEATERSIYGYNGEEYNQAIESQYLRGRYYTPKAGRFFVEDSYQGNIVNPLSLNKYAYGLNNPLRYRDPSGHIAMDLGNDMNTYSPQTKIGYQQPTAQAPVGGTFKLTGPAGKAKAEWVRPQVYHPASEKGYLDVDPKYVDQVQQIAKIAEEKRKKICDGLENADKLNQNNQQQSGIEWNRVKSGIDKVVDSAMKLGMISAFDLAVITGLNMVSAGTAGTLAAVVSIGYKVYNVTKILGKTAEISNLVEGLQDVIYGFTGNTTDQSINLIRESVFLGDQENYDAAQLIDYIIMGASGGTVIAGGNVSWNNTSGSDSAISTPITNTPPNSGKAFDTTSTDKIQYGVDPNTLKAGNRAALDPDRLQTQKDYITNGIKRDGNLVSVIKVNKQGVVVDGHHGIRAAIEAGASIDVVVVNDNVRPSGVPIADMPIIEKKGF